MNNHEFCIDYIVKMAAGKPATVLDYGCGAGVIVAGLRAKNIDARGCDIFYAGGDSSNRVPSELINSIIKPMKNAVIPFPDESFDFLVSNQVLEHVDDIESVLTEMYRVLKPGGKILSLFPDKSVWREGHCGIPFLHWFPKGSQLRIYYAVALRAIGMGYFKGNKSIWIWSQDFCTWLDRWTWYRSHHEIKAAFESRFEGCSHIEEVWLRARLEEKAAIAEWLPRSVQRWVVRKLGGLVFVCSK